MKAPKEHKPQQSRVIQSRRFVNNKHKSVSNVSQRILITDVPSSGDFSNITDLGIWWAMAAEFHFQQNLPVNVNNQIDLDPLNYIRSLHDYVNPRNLPGPINIAPGDRLRMLTHGGNPDDFHGGHVVFINNRFLRANRIVNRIGNHVTPLYCFMGNNPQHRNLIPGIGNGPLLSPSLGTVSLNEQMTRLALRYVRNPNNKTWGHIINNQGMWIPIYAVPQLSGLFRRYIRSVRNNGVNSPLTTQYLRTLLIKVYNTVNQPYNDFAQYLINQNANTGQGPSLWP